MHLIVLTKWEEQTSYPVNQIITRPTGPTCQSNYDNRIFAEESDHAATRYYLMAYAHMHGRS